MSATVPPDLPYAGDGDGDGAILAARCLSELDPDLLDGELQNRLRHSRSRVAVHAVRLTGLRGAAAAERMLTSHRLGALVVDGHLGVSWPAGDRTALELCGPGDVIGAPVDWTAAGAPPAEAQLVSRTVTMVPFDERFEACAAALPGLAIAVARRHAERAGRLAGWLALMNQPHVERRLVMAMDRLGQRWGRVRTDGVLVPLPLTHRMMGQLVGARRPTVTVALGHLAGQGTLERCSEGWLLRRPPADGSGAVLTGPALASADGGS